MMLMFLTHRAQFELLAEKKPKLNPAVLNCLHNVYGSGAVALPAAEELCSTSGSTYMSPSTGTLPRS
jgi:hypothetical protein